MAWTCRDAAQQDPLAATKGSFAANLVEVYRSPGGGWEVRQSNDRGELLPEATREETKERADRWDRAFEER